MQVCVDRKWLKEAKATLKWKKYEKSQNIILIKKKKWIVIHSALGKLKCHPVRGLVLLREPINLPVERMTYKWAVLDNLQLLQLLNKC